MCQSWQPARIYSIKHTFVWGDENILHPGLHLKWRGQRAETETTSTDGPARQIRKGKGLIMCDGQEKNNKTGVKAGLRESNQKVWG